MKFTRLAEWLYLKCRKIAVSRNPDYIIGADYCRRWYIIPRNRIFNIYLHQFLHSDDDRALHDHPWWSISLILKGGYMEITATDPEHPHVGTRMMFYQQGHLLFRSAARAHRIVIDEHSTWTYGKCWTLFITGPAFRTWGFHCPQGWRPWMEFVNPSDKTQVGKGCD